MTRSMLKENKLPLNIWGEAVAFVAYVLNMCPTKRLKEIVPLEKWTKEKQSVSHLKVFGSVCYKHVPEARRKKMDDRSRVMLLVGVIPKICPSHFYTQVHLNIRVSILD